MEKSFPYKQPSPKIKKKFSYIFNDISIPNRFSKLLFDKFISSLALITFTPLLIMLKTFFVLEGFLVPENKGPMFFYYYAVSQGKVFKKYKIRIIKTKYIDTKLASKGEWSAYKAEWNNYSRTYVGSFVKNSILMRFLSFGMYLKVICLLLAQDLWQLFIIKEIWHKVTFLENV